MEYVMHLKSAQAVIYGEPEDAKALAKEALMQSLDPLACIAQGLTRGTPLPDNDPV